MNAQRLDYSRGYSPDEEIERQRREEDRCAKYFFGGMVFLIGLAAVGYGALRFLEWALTP